MLYSVRNGMNTFRSRASGRLRMRSLKVRDAPVRSMSASPDAEAVRKANAATNNADIEIRQTPEQRGWGLFARRNLSEGQRLFRGRALQSDSKPGSHSVQTDWNTHVLMDLPAILINHSCGANAGIRPNDLGAYDFYALRNICKDEEVLWDYETAEYEVAVPFTCSCGDVGCRGTLRGFRFNGELLVDKYGEPFIAPYLMVDLQRRETE